MKNNLRPLLFSAFCLLGLIGLFSAAPSSLFAQAAPAASGVVDITATTAQGLGSLLTAITGVAPAWLVSALSIFGTVSVAYQALIAFAHKRAAETADVDDDNWIASLEAKAWFRLLDKIFYWGGYLGAKSGGKKL